jgi:hypothetical protein
MTDSIDEDNWLKSQETQEELHISACDLMHLRLEGKLRFQKKGNAFLYAQKDVQNLKSECKRTCP